MSLPRITLDQWSALAAVVEQGGYARAAATLNKSQSAVTYSVQQIESQLGIKVVEIKGRKAALTPTGESLYHRARYLLDEASALEQASKRLSAGWEATVRIAVEQIFPTWLLLQCLAKLGGESPQTRVELIEAVIGHRTDTLVSGLADLAIFASVPPGFLGDALMRVRFIYAANPEHALHKLGRPLTARDLHGERHIVVRESNPERSTATTLDTTQRWTVGHMATSIAAVCAGDGFALLPEELIKNELAAGSLQPLPMAEGGERFAELYLIYADPEHTGPAAKRLADIIRESVAKECARAAQPAAESRERSGN